MASTLLGAMVELVRQSPARVTVGDRIFAGAARDSETLPHIVIKHSGETPDWTFEDTVKETGAIEIWCFAVGADKAESIAYEVRKFLDWTGQLSIAETSNVSTMRTQYQVDASEERDAQGNVVFFARLNYEVSYSYSYTGL